MSDEADEEALLEKERRAKENAAREVLDLRAVMSSPQGRRFVWRLLDAAGVFSASYTADPNSTAYAEGRRAMGLWLMREAQTVARDPYVAMVREALELQLQALPPVEETRRD